MIRYVTPYATDTDKNLARAYNEEISRAKSGEYVCFIDRDVWFPHPHFGHQIERIVALHGEAFYTCVTNRTNCDWQRIKVIGNDRYMQEVAEMRYEEFGSKIEAHTQSPLWSGHLMLVPKDKWIPLEENTGLLGIDNQIHLMARNQGVNIYLMKGIYVWHYYSGYDGGQGHKNRNKEHLK